MDSGDQQSVVNSAPSFARPTRWALMAACCYGMMTLSFVNAGHAFWLPSIAGDLGLNEAASGLFLSCAFWGMVVAILIAGVLADRYGYRVLLVGSALCQGMSLLLVSYASAGWSVFAAVSLGSIGTGTVLALATPVAFTLYPKARTRVSYLVQSFSGVGSVVVILVALVLFHKGWIWREAYRLVAVLVIPYGLAFLLLPLPESICREGEKRLEMRELLRRGSFGLLLVAGFLLPFVQVGVSMWLPSYIETVMGGTRSASGIGIILCGGVVSLGMWLNSALSRHLGIKWVSLIGGLLSVFALLAAAMTTDTVVAIGCFALLMFGISGIGPVVLAHAGDRFPSGGVSMYSLLFAIGNLGCAVGPLVIGLLAGYWTMQATMAVMAIGPLAAMLLLLLLLSQRSRLASVPAREEPEYLT